MSDDQTDIELPEDQQDVVDMVADGEDGDPTDQEKNLAIAQAKLIGDL